MNTIKNYASFYFCIFFIILFSGFVTYTPDLVIYEYWLNNNLGRDIFFNLISNIVNFYSLEYRGLHLIYITLSAFLLSFVVGISGLNRVLIVILWISLEYLAFTTQIRFFFSYFLSILAIYIFEVKKRRLISFFLFSLALLNHLSIVLVPFMYFLFITLESSFIKNITRVFVFFIALSFVYLFYAQPIVDILLQSYITNQKNISSLAGGIYSAFGSILCIGFVYYIGNWCAIKIAIKNGDQILQFLYRLAVMPVIILIPGLFIKVINDRFLDTSILFFLMFVFYSNRYLTKGKSFVWFMTIIILLINFWTRYFQDFFIFGTMPKLNETLAILGSIQFY